MKDIHGKIQHKLSQSADRQLFAKIAIITAVNTGGRYNVELTGGQEISNLNSISYGSKFYVGQWVTLEFFGGDWVISGESAQRGGD